MSLATLVPQITILIFAGLVVWAAVNDVRSLIIPNRICIAIAALYPAYVLSAPGSVDWKGALVVSSLILVVGFGLFLLSFRGMPLMGPGDTKLLTVSALWAGPQLLPELLVIMALAGGVIAVHTWLRHRGGVPAAATGTGAAVTGVLSLLRIPFVKLPYGLAICAGAVFVAVRLLLGV